MALPDPKPGLVLRYDYLWSREAMRGREQSKDRPVCIVAASEPTARPRFVVILPITHSRPRGATVGIEIPPKVRQALGLDDERSWVIVSEYNVDEWPNGLAPIPGRTAVFAYGFIPPALFVAIKKSFLGLAESGRAARVKR